MILTVNNTTPINLTCSIGPSALALHHGSDALADHELYLFAELPATGPIYEAEVVLADFTHDDDVHQVYAWEADPTGGVQPWTRGTNGSTSGLREDMPETDVLVVAVPPGVSVPSPTSTSGPPAPGTTQTTITVKVRKQGGMPFDPSRYR